MILSMVNMFCDPDYLNQKIIDFLISRDTLRQSTNKKFSHAANYEDFIRIIKSSNNIEDIKQFHLNIMNEIMQVTLINEFKNLRMLSEENSSGNKASSVTTPISTSNGIVNSGLSSFYASFSDVRDVEVEQQKPINSEKHSKVDHLKSRDLKQYLKQLRYAKKLCERRLNRRSGVNCLSFDEDNFEANLELKIQNKKV